LAPIKSDDSGEERESPDIQDVIAAMLEPLPGHSDEEVVESLRNAGALAVKILTPGFISAKASRAALRNIEAIAYVHPKRQKQTRVA
jgi:hypothetical protein